MYIVVWYLGPAWTLVPAVLAAVGGRGEGLYAHQAWVRCRGGKSLSKHLFSGKLTQWQTAYRDVALFSVEKIDYPYNTSTVFNVPSTTEGTADQKIGDLVVVDYRYARFALDPRTGLFSMIRLVLLYLQ